MNPVITAYLIKALAALLLGTDVFQRLQAVVERQEEKAKANPALTGPDKKAAVLAEVEVVGLQLASWLLNLGIELAVAKLRVAAQ